MSPLSTIQYASSQLMKRAIFTENTQYDPSVMLLLTVGSAMIFIMVPGLAFLYSGLARRKSALGNVWVVMMCSMVGIFQWYFWGYSLAFSGTASNKFIGNLRNFGYMHMIEKSSPDAAYPEIAYSIFQMQFMLVTVAILAGACVAERGRLLPAMVFCFLWATVVYCPIVYWVWNSNGWAFNFKSGVLDYAGGGPVEIASGFSAIAYSYQLGKRRDSSLINYRPHNVSTIYLGVALLYVGWLFFNGFSCLTVSVKIPYSMMNTHLSAAFGALTWTLLDYRIEKKWSMVAVCSGCISGLVAATPASGCIPLWASVILGITSGIICNYSTKIKYIIGVDDSLDVLAEHGIAGVIGLVFNGLFGDSTVIGYDGVTEHEGGWLNHNYKQLYIQIAYILACCSYSVVVSWVLSFIIDKIPGLHLRVELDGEERGIDEDQIGEFAYDYVEVRRDFLDWAPTAVNNTSAPSVVDEAEVLIAASRADSSSQEESNEKRETK